MSAGLACSPAPDRLDWARDGRDWPLRSRSRFVQAGGLRWHVQRGGQGTPVLFVHGTGASTHSWHALVERLGDGFEWVAFDLPGHGFTDPPARGDATLIGVSRLVGSLLDALDFAPRLVVGHSAGAAILCRMAIDGRIAPAHLVALNGALRPYWGRVSRIFSALARGLAESELPARLVARRARSSDSVDRMLDATGSRLEEAEIAWYRRLASSPSHVQAALRMMAGWDLVTLWQDLPRLEVPLLLLVGERDRFVRPEESEAVVRRVPRAERIVVSDVGHLLHEERPEAVAWRLRALDALSAAPAPRPASR
ncbi:MAG: alpha/beta fold hydrolase BchO [Myxococcota bacterium]